MFLFGPIIGAVARSGALAGALVTLGLLAAIGGAVVGQIGRGMQGRVI
jgi:hypothetical protein